MKKTLVWVSSAVALTVLSAGAAFSQPGGDGWEMMEGRRGQMMEWMMDRHPLAGCMMMAMHGRGDPHIEGRIAFLKAELGVTEAQSEAWNNFASTLKANLQNLKNLAPAVKTFMQANTPMERLDARITILEKRLAALKELKPALAKLSDAFSPEQKQKAEELLFNMGCLN